MLQPTELLNQADIDGIGNEAFIKQAGVNNTLELMQDQEGLEGNLTRALQNGNWNVAVLSQTGTGNKLVLLQQGNNNFYELLNNGFDNESAVIQNGEDNIIVQKLLNSGGVKTEFVQIGNSNEINAELLNIQGGDFTVRQIGEGLKLIIRQSSF